MSAKTVSAVIDLVEAKELDRFPKLALFKIDELFASDRELPEILEEVARLGAQLLMQAALEAEVTEFLGRDRYQRSATAPDARSGGRNGYRPATVKTTAGPITWSGPSCAVRPPRSPHACSASMSAGPTRWNRW